MMERKHLRVVVLLVAMVALVATPALADCLKCKVKGFVAAHNRQDVDKAMSYFAEDFRCHDTAMKVEVDRDGFRNLLERDVATGSKLMYEDLQWDGEGDTVTAVFVESGTEPRTFRVEFRFEDNLVRELVLDGRDGESWMRL
jgi:hypothetical protein